MRSPDIHPEGDAVFHDRTVLRNAVSDIGHRLANRMKVFGAVATIALVVASGCGGEGDSSDPLGSREDLQEIEEALGDTTVVDEAESPNPETRVGTPSGEFASGQQLADAIGCSNFGSLMVGDDLPLRVEEMESLGMTKDFPDPEVQTFYDQVGILEASDFIELGMCDKNNVEHRLYVYGGQAPENYALPYAHTLLAETDADLGQEAVAGVAGDTWGVETFDYSSGVSGPERAAAEAIRQALGGTLVEGDGGLSSPKPIS